jgi:uncharacterized repeat protein (TIGR02543 family)
MYYSKKNRFKGFRYLLLISVLVFSLVFPPGGFVNPKEAKAVLPLVGALALGAATGAICEILTEIGKAQKIPDYELTPEKFCDAAVLGALKGVILALFIFAVESGVVAAVCAKFAISATSVLSWTDAILQGGNSVFTLFWAWDQVNPQDGMWLITKIQERVAGIFPCTEFISCLAKGLGTPLSIYCFYNEVLPQIRNNVHAQMGNIENWVSPVADYFSDDALPPEGVSENPVQTLDGVKLFHRENTSQQSLFGYKYNDNIELFLNLSLLSQGSLYSQAHHWGANIYIYENGQKTTLDIFASLIFPGGNSASTYRIISGQELLNKVGKGITEGATIKLGLELNIYDSQNNILESFDSLSSETLEEIVILPELSAITITSPNGGEQWQLGETKNITWTSAGSPGSYVKIEISRNGGTSWTTLTDSTDNDGNYSWTISGDTSINCLIRITSTNNSNITDVSNGTYSILPACSGHDLKVEFVASSPSSIKPTQTTTISANVVNKKSTTENNINVTLNVSGPGGYACTKNITIPSLTGPNGVTQVSFTWPSGSGACASAGSDGSYTATVSAISSLGCDEDLQDNQGYVGVWVSESGNPPNHVAYKVKGYELQLGQSATVNGKTYKFENIATDDAVQLTITGEGTDWYDYGEGYLTTDNAQTFWTHRVINASPKYIHLAIGPYDDSKGFSPYSQNVFQGNTAEFIASLNYDSGKVYGVTGSETSGRVIDLLNDPPGDYSDSGTTFSVGTSDVALGTYRFCVLSNSIQLTGDSYLAFGRFNVVAPVYTLSLQKGGAGTGQVKVNGALYDLPCAMSFTSGTSVSLEAIYGNVSQFNGWTGDVTGTTNPTTISMNGNKNITANFKLVHTLTLEKLGTGSGQIKVNGTLRSLPHNETFDENAVVNIEAIPDTGSSFVEWSGDQSGSITPTTVTMTGNKSVYAKFLLLRTLTAHVSPTDSGYIMADGTPLNESQTKTYIDGQYANLTAISSLGYGFINWGGDAGTGSVINSQILMNGNKSVTANFAKVLNTPNLVYPANEAHNQPANLSLTWTDTNSSPQENGYKVRIRPLGGSYTEYSATQDDTSYPLSGLIAGVTYYWSVKAVGNGTSTLDSAYPADRSFTVTDTALKGDLRGDFNGDGNQDILWRNSQTGQVNVWLTKSNEIGILSKGTLGTVADMNWEIIGVGNFNTSTDTKTDILWRNKQTGQVNVWLINGTAKLSSSTLGTVSDLNWGIINTGDFDSNSNTDLLWRNSLTGQVNVWLTNPASIGVSSKGTLGTVPDTNWEIIGVGNFNALDTKTDILWRNKQTGQVNVWLVNGTALLSKGTLGTVSDLNWGIVNTGDFNFGTDSNTDLLWRNKDTGQVNVWLTNPDSIGVSGKGTLGTVADTNWEIIGVGNFNTDSNTDLLWRNKLTGQVNVWLTNPAGIGILNKGPLGTVSDLNWGIINTGDFNTGSNTDLLWRNSQTGQVNVWLTNPDAIGVSGKGTLGTVADMNWEIQ